MWRGHHRWRIWHATQCCHAPLDAPWHTSLLWYICQQFHILQLHLPCSWWRTLCGIQLQILGQSQDDQRSTILHRLVRMAASKSTPSKVPELGLMSLTLPTRTLFEVKGSSASNGRLMVPLRSTKHTLGFMQKFGVDYFNIFTHFNWAFLSALSHLSLLDLKCSLSTCRASALWSIPASKCFQHLRRDWTTQCVWMISIVYIWDVNTTYQCEPTSFNWNGSSVHPKPHANEPKTSHGCSMRHCSVVPTRSQWFHHPPAPESALHIDTCHTSPRPQECLPC